MKHRRERARALALGWLATGLVASTAWGSFTNDREYLLGDDAGELGVAGQPAGVPIDTSLFTFDSKGVGGTGNFQDLEVLNGPTYADVSARPFAGGSQVGIAFDGVDDYLSGDNLNLPENSAASITAGGPENYVGIANRGFQFWVKPSSAGQGNALAQSLVVDTNEHGARITANDTWSLRYAGDDFDSNIPVTFDQWHHVMVVRPFGPGNGARMYVDGVAVAAAPGGYDGGNVEDLVIGSNTSLDVDGNFAGGTAEFFNGVVDDLTMFVLGDNSDSDLNPPGQNYGSFVVETDNQFIAGSLTGVAGDVNQDGVLDSGDVDDFVAGWNSRNLVNDIQLGDLTTLASGDLNFDGLTDLQDAVILDNALLAQGAGLNLALLPEPATLTLLGIGLMFARRRRR